jgi:hypothetical protein
MKIMAGAVGLLFSTMRDSITSGILICVKKDPSKKPDYASQTSKELDKVQHRVLLLNEMLDNVKAGEKFVEGDSYYVSVCGLMTFFVRLA